MAIAKMEKVAFIAPKSQQKAALRLFQAFQKVELYQTESLNRENPVLVQSQDMQVWKDSLQQLDKARTVLIGLKKSNALQQMRTGRQTVTFYQLERQMADNPWGEVSARALQLDRALQDNRKQRRDCIRLADEWRPWQKLEAHPKEFSGLRKSAATAGTLPSELKPGCLSELGALPDGRIYFETVFETEKKLGLLVLGKKESWKEIREILDKYDFTAVQYPYDAPPKDMLAQWSKQEAALVEEEQELLDALTQMADQLDTLDIADEYFRNRILREEARQYLLQSNTCFLLSGWVTQDEKPALEEYLKSNMKAAYSLTFEEPSEEEYPQTPISLKNNKIVGAFENLTEMYSMPAYNEIDPTPFMAPFYLVFFGMMAADIGYGLILFLATFAARKFLKPDRGFRKSLDFFYYLSFPTILWGVIYGSFFGITTPFVLLSTTEDIFPILILSIIFGWLQIMTGLGLGSYLNLKKKDVLGAVSAGFAWMGLLVGLALIVIALLVLNVQGLFYAAVILTVLSALTIVAVPVIQSKHSRVKGVLKGLYALYGATGYIGDLVSYTRLMALGISGGSIAVAFNTIIASLPLPARLTAGVVLCVVLHGLNLFLAFLGAYVHGIRLQYVEFFGKFYSGGGRKFDPFKPVEKRVYIVSDGDANEKYVEELL